MTCFKQLECFILAYHNYAMLKHVYYSDWMLRDTWLVLANESASLQHSIVMYAKICLWHWLLPDNFSCNCFRTNLPRLTTSRWLIWATDQICHWPWRTSGDQREWIANTYFGGGGHSWVPQTRYPRLVIYLTKNTAVSFLIKSRNVLWPTCLFAQDW